MTPEPTTPTIPSRWRIGRIVRWLFLVVLAVLGYGAWREYDFRAAVKEAQALGWKWAYDDPIETIRKDWKAAFRKATWDEGIRQLIIADGAGFEGKGRLLQRLAPKSLMVWGGPELRDLSALSGLSALRDLYLMGFSGLTNADGLKGLAALQTLNLSGCPRLTNVDVLKGFPALQNLRLAGCTGLTNVDALKGLRALRNLDLSGCTGLTNVDGLKGLSALQMLILHGCIELRNADGLNGLSALLTLDLSGCTKLPAQAIAELRAALPNTKIIPPQ